MNHTALRATLVAQRAAIDASIAQIDAEAAGTRPERWLSVADASKMTGKSPARIRGMARAGTIEYKTTEGGGKMWVRLAA